MSSSKTTAFLDKSSDWDEWLKTILTKAKRRQISDLVDPDKPTPIQPIEPRLPLPEDLNSAFGTDLTLTAEQIQIHQVRMGTYRVQKASFDHKMASLEAISDTIFSSIDRRHLTYINSEDTVHGNLCALRKRIAPTDIGRELELRNSYQELLKGPTNQDLEKYIERWEKLTNEMTTANLTEIQGTKPLYDFLLAVKSIATSYTDTKMAKLDSLRRKGKPLLTLFDLFEDYRNYYRANKRHTKSSSHTAFASFQNEHQQGSSTSSDQSSDFKPPRPCLCHANHRFRDCPYLIEHKRDLKWTPDPAIQKEIADKLAANPNLEKKIGYIRKGSEKRKNRGSDKNDTTDSHSTTSGGSVNAPSVANKGSFAIQSSFNARREDTTADYAQRLRTNWIVDSGSDVHICNETARFCYQRTAPEDDTIMAGASILNVTAYGTAEIDILTSDGPATITLLNVALIPGFLANIISLRKFTNKGIHFDTANERLHRQGVTFCYTDSLGSHWILKKDIKARSDVKISFAANQSNHRTQKWLYLTGTRLLVILAQKS
jgi:hypothetical protein